MSENNIIKVNGQLGTRECTIISNGKYHALNNNESNRFKALNDYVISNVMSTYCNSLMNDYWLPGFELDPEDIKIELSRYGFNNADANILNFENYRKGVAILRNTRNGDDETTHVLEDFARRIRQLRKHYVALDSINIYTHVYSDTGDRYCVELSFHKVDKRNPWEYDMIIKMISDNRDDTFMLAHRIKLDLNSTVVFSSDSYPLFFDNGLQKQWPQSLIVNNSYKLAKNRFSDFIKYQFTWGASIFCEQYYLMELVNAMMSILCRKHIESSAVDENGFVTPPMTYVSYSKYAVEHFTTNAYLKAKLLTKINPDDADKKLINSRKYTFMSKYDMYPPYPSDQIAQAESLIEDFNKSTTPIIMFTKRENQYVEKFMNSYIGEHPTIDMHMLMSHMRYGSVFKVKNSELFNDKTVLVSCRYDESSTEIYILDKLPENIFAGVCFKIAKGKEFVIGHDITSYYEFIANIDSNLPSSVNDLIAQSIINDGYQHLYDCMVYIIGLLIVIHERPHRSKMIRNVKYTNETVIDDKGNKQVIEKPYVISRILRPAKEADDLLKNSPDVANERCHRRESNYVVAEWERIGHWRTLKSGKVVWIPGTVCHRRKMNTEKPIYVKL